jgi:hypothetical protein
MTKQWLAETAKDQAATFRCDDLTLMTPQDCSLLVQPGSTKQEFFAMLRNGDLAGRDVKPRLRIAQVTVLVAEG